MHAEDLTRRSIMNMLYTGTAVALFLMQVLIPTNAVAMPFAHAVFFSCQMPSNRGEFFMKFMINVLVSQVKVPIHGPFEVQMSIHWGPVQKSYNGMMTLCYCKKHAFHDPMLKFTKVKPNSLVNIFSIPSSSMRGKMLPESFELHMGGLQFAQRPNFHNHSMPRMILPVILPNFGKPPDFHVLGFRLMQRQEFYAFPFTLLPVTVNATFMI